MNGSDLTSSQVNVKNKLTDAVGLACSYDANGNMTNRVYDSVGPKSYFYVYDDENQLIELRTDTSATPTGSRWRTTWLYDGLGRARLRKDYYWSGTWTQNGETRYIYDGMRVIQERDSSNTPAVVYTRGNDLSGSLEGAGGIGGLLARSHGYSSGTWSTHNHYHADGNGNVTFLVNSGQTAEAWYRYDPYGRTMAQSATALTTENLYRFSSKEIHAQSGMYYYGFRFYDPHLQRWPNQDPIEEDGTALLDFARRVVAASREPQSNLHRFVANSPTTYFDPLGLDHVQEPGFTRPLTEVGPMWSDLWHCIPSKARKCITLCAKAHLPMRATCVTGCAFTGAGFPKCVLLCNGVVNGSQAVCTATCIAAPE